jgi:hypothetical protein
MIKPITRLEDARVLRKMGAPLNIPIEYREFSREYSEHWFDLQNAHSKFMIAVYEFSDGPRAGSPGKWRLVKRRFVALGKEMLKCDAFVGKLGGVVTPGDPLVFKSEQDAHECQLLSMFLTDRAMPFADYWQDAIEAVDDGIALAINPGDMPTWFDAETEGTAA